jgi:CDP-glucose 4,6-dehydratase
MIDRTIELRAKILDLAGEYCADPIAQTYAHTYGPPVAVTRCGNFYVVGGNRGTP